MRRILTFVLLIAKYEVYSEIIRTPLGLINRPITETIIEAPRYINQPQIISDQPCNLAGNYPNLPISVPNYPNIPISVNNLPIARPNREIFSISNLPINQIASECTPSVCKDLANTIQIMTVANLIQSTQSDKLAAKLANPIFRDIISSPFLPCGCPNPIYKQVQGAKIIPNAQIAQKILPREVIASNYVNPNGPIILPNMGPNSPIILPNMAPNSPKILGPVPEQLDGRVNSAVLKNILQILGNGV